MPRLIQPYQTGGGTSRTGAFFDAAAAALNLFAQRRNKQQLQQQQSEISARIGPWFASLPPEEQAKVLPQLAKESPAFLSGMNFAPVAPDPTKAAQSSAQYALAGFDPTTKTFAPLPADPAAAAVMLSARNALGFGGDYGRSDAVVEQTNLAALPKADQPPALRVHAKLAPTADVVAKETGESTRATARNASELNIANIKAAADRDVAGVRATSAEKVAGTKATGLGGADLSDYSKKAIAEIDPLLAQVSKVIDGYAQYKDQDNMLTDRDLGSYARYRAGGALDESDPMSLAAPMAMLDVSAAARILKGGSRSMQALKLAKQHTPNPTSTRASIYQRAVQMYAYLKDARDAAIAEGGDVTAEDARNNVPRPASFGPKATGANSPAPAAGPQYKMTATGANGQKIGSNDGVSWFDLGTGQKVQ